MRRIAEVVAQVALLALFALVIGHYSREPRFAPHAPGEAQVTLSFSHAGAPVSDCRPLTAEELAALPPNMRKSEECPRERVPVHVELVLDGELAFSAAAPPSGLWRDGESHFYRKFPVPAGPHTIDIRMRDSRRDAGHDHEARFHVDLVTGAVAAIDFDHALSTFVLH